MAATQDDELLSMLLVSLRNASETFGEGSPAYETIRATIEQHVQAMKARNQTTNITNARRSPQIASGGQNSAETPASALSFGSLTFRPKPGSG